MPETSSATSGKNSPGRRVGRGAERKAVGEFVRGRTTGAVSQRQYAAETGIPRSTLQRWVGREVVPGVDAEIAAFFETSAGVAFLHRITLAAQLVLCWMGVGGVRLVCSFVTAAGLAPFIANSYGEQHGVAAEVQAALVAFGADERERLTPGMLARQITTCNDETFPSGEICLVAVEPVTGFVLLEKVVERRDAQTWNAEMSEAIAGMPVEVVQSTSDEAKALIRHADDLGAHHSPDVFHVQHEICAAVSLPLHQRLRAAEEAVREAADALERRLEHRAAYRAGPRRPGRPPDFESQIRDAEVKHAMAEMSAKTAAKAWEGWLRDVRAIGDTYHPYDLTSGRAQSPEVVSSKLRSAMDGLRDTARQAGLPERSVAGIEKAARVVPRMIDTIAFYDSRVTSHLNVLDLSPEEESLVRDVLLPAAYMDRAARRAESARRGPIRETARRLREAIPAHTLPEVRTRLERVAGRCADEFQRSSSCVEGRNGRLSQYHHALRGVSPAKRAALTVVQNYHVTRPDGTTAAERFFGAPPKNLMDYLVERVSVPARPARHPHQGRNNPRIQSAK